MEIMTERLCLRPWEDADAAALYRYGQDPRVGPAAGWSPITDELHALGVIRGVLSAPETYAVVLRETGEPVGSAGIKFAGNTGTPVAAHETELGYWIGVPYWGRGLIPEAVNALLARCFTALCCTGVWCGYYEGNERSRRVQEKCGFVYSHDRAVVTSFGEPRTEHFTFLSREAWRARQTDG